MRVSSGTSDTQQSFILLYPDTNEEMAQLEIALIRYNQTDEPITMKKEIADNNNVLVFKFLIGRSQKKSR